MIASGSCPGVTLPVPLACTASVLIGAVVPEEIETLVEMSAPKATRPADAPGFKPTGLPQLATRAIPTRSPACTGTAGASATALEVLVTLKGPRSERKTSVSPLRRKNLIFTVAAHGALDQTKDAEVIWPVPVAGNAGPPAVRPAGEGLKPRFPREGMLPAVIVWACAAVAPVARRTTAASRRIGCLDIGTSRIE